MLHLRGHPVGISEEDGIGARLGSVDLRTGPDWRLLGHGPGGERPRWRRHLEQVPLEGKEIPQGNVRGLAIGITQGKLRGWAIRLEILDQVPLEHLETVEGRPLEVG